MIESMKGVATIAAFVSAFDCFCLQLLINKTEAVAKKKNVFMIEVEM
jgi:hypothetical protein